MPQPQDYLAAYVLVCMVAILGCGAAVVALIAAVDHMLERYRRAVLRRRRGQ